MDLAIYNILWFIMYYQNMRLEPQMITLIESFLSHFFVNEFSPLSGEALRKSLFQGDMAIDQNDMLTGQVWNSLSIIYYGL